MHIETKDGIRFEVDDKFGEISYIKRGNLQFKPKLDYCLVLEGKTTEKGTNPIIKISSQLYLGENTKRRSKLYIIEEAIESNEYTLNSLVEGQQELAFSEAIRLVENKIRDAVSSKYAPEIKEILENARVNNVACSYNLAIWANRDKGVSYRIECKNFIPKGNYQTVKKH